MSNKDTQYEIIGNETFQKLNKFLGKDRRLLCLIKFGSHLYGTSTKESDTDYKGVYLPSKIDYFLQSAPKTYHANTGDGLSKNSKDDIDIELFSLNYFFELAIQGQTVAIDMLHAGEKFTEKTSKIWNEIVNSRSKFYQKELKAFVGYAQKQAAKYGIKGSRLNAVSEFLKLTDNFDKNEKMSNVWRSLNVGEHCFFREENGQEFYNICGKNLQKTITIGYARDIMQKFYDNYGDRARKAANSEGVDWKAISHALRACFELEEIYRFGSISFPLKDAKFLLEVKNGEHPYPYVSKILEDKISEVHKLAINSNYPEKLDRNMLNMELFKLLSEEL